MAARSSSLSLGPVLPLVLSLSVSVACGPGDGDDDGGVIDSGQQIDAPMVVPDGAPIPDAAPPTPVNVIITADNAYGFGYGTADTMSNYFGGLEATTAGEIFNCPIGNGAEQYLVPANDADVGNYLYIIGYADSSTTQGVLGQFFRDGGQPVYTGQGNWEVCATGVNFSPGSGGPDLAEINTQIGNCNAANTDPATTSVGWVDETGTANGQLTFGEDNSTPRNAVEVGNEFPIVCGMDPEARWMWFNWDPANIDWPTNGSPFIWPGGGGNPDKQFLIFRIPAEDIPIIL